ncbi:MAG: ClpXP protease specificity-enhancing factor [Pseudoxanthomonas suwonensis]|nr:MAG: ClpXP protease specificity-enhancing factor [Pseudoxanthomonas suwonensis]
MNESAPSAMTSYRPYLLRALWEWIADNGMTPHILVDATRPGVQVPPQTVKDGRVVLNIADQAVGKLHMGNDAVTFHARFGGVSHAVSVPVAAVLAIYSRETGQGMAMPDDPVEAAADPVEAGAAPVPAIGVSADPPDDEPPAPKRGGHLRVVK